MDLGDSLTWGEAYLLIQAAAQDPSTMLGSELAGWAYPASMVDLLSLSAAVGEKSSTIMPWNLHLSGEPQFTDQEIQAAQAALDEEILFV